MPLPIETPAVLVDLEVAKRNVERFQAYADEHGIRVRPHIKTHKLPQMAELQLEAGAVGITCQKVTEAEAMVRARGDGKLEIGQAVRGGPDQPLVAGHGEGHGRCVVRVEEAARPSVGSRRV